MKTRHNVTAALCLTALGCLVVGTAPDGAALAPPPGLGEAHYVLSVDSIFAEGCMGGGPYGCMCPLWMASEFEGTFTLTPNPRIPPGHQAYDVAIEDWFIAFGDDEMVVTGDGYYDRWTDLQGSRWQYMTLDLELYGEIVHFESGVVEADAPDGEFPLEVHIDLDNQAECYGFVILLDADRLMIAPGQDSPDDEADSVSFVDVK